MVDGATLIVADLGYQIDNMEGIGVHRNAPGETILTLVSDDNFSVIQRNLLLQFALVALAETRTRTRRPSASDGGG